MESGVQNGPRTLDANRGVLETDYQKYGALLLVGLEAQVEKSVWMWLPSPDQSCAQNALAVLAKASDVSSCCRCKDLFEHPVALGFENVDGNLPWRHRRVVESIHDDVEIVLDEVEIVQIFHEAVMQVFLSWLVEENVCLEQLVAMDLELSSEVVDF